MIYGKDLKHGDMVYDSNVEDWAEKDDGKAFDKRTWWLPIMAIEEHGRIFLPSYTHSDAGDWITVHCNTPEPTRKYGETPAEALRFDLERELAYHRGKVAEAEAVQRTYADRIGEPIS